jgi:hypothetical protein
MAISLLTPVSYLLQGDGASTSFSFNLGFEPISVSLVSALYNGVDVSANITSITLNGQNMKVTFLAAFAYEFELIVNFIPALSTLIVGSVNLVTGISATYYAASGTVSANVVTPTFTPVPGIVFQLQGSATKIVKIVRFNLSGHGGYATGAVDVVMSRYSTTATGGTAVAISPGVANPVVDAPATAVAKYFTAPPTAGTFAQGPIRCEAVTFCESPAVLQPFVSEFGTAPGARAFVLNGVNDFFVVSIVGAINGNVCEFWVEWTEQ